MEKKTSNQNVERKLAELEKANTELKLELARQRDAQVRATGYQKQLQALTSEVILAEEAERRRLAEALHDNAGQTLAFCLITLDRVMKSPVARELVGLEDLRTHLRGLAREIRSLTFEMSPPILYDLGLEAAVEQLTREMALKHKLNINFSNDGQMKPLDKETRILLFQIVRELLLNVVKHAQAQNSVVCIERVGNFAQIIVRDDGIGFDPGLARDPSRTTGFGLFSIRERVNRIGGRLKASKGRPSGAVITVRAPLAQTGS